MPVQQLACPEKATAVRHAALNLDCIGRWRGYFFAFATAESGYADPEIAIRRAEIAVRCFISVDTPPPPPSSPPASAPGESPDSKPPNGLGRVRFTTITPLCHRDRAPRAMRRLQNGAQAVLCV